MNLSVGQKIFGIALFLLVVMIGAATVAIHLTDRISDELEIISRQHLPVSDRVSRINVLVLEQGVILQRAIADRGNAAARKAERDQVAGLGREIEAEFQKARRLLLGMGKAGRMAAKELAANLGTIEQAYRAFIEHGGKVHSARDAGGGSGLAGLVPRLNELQDKVDGAIAKLRRSLEALTDRSVAKANRDELNLLILNIMLTALAAAIGLFFATLVTRALMRSVRNLVAGTEAVEAGRLDTEVSVTSTDEVGQLTRSFNHMTGELRLKERIKDTFGRYMDPRIVTRLLDEPGIAEPGGERRDMTVMFIDLKGFTSISERLEPASLVHMINDFFTLMGAAVADNQGVVDKYMGDAVMAFWGPPFTGTGDHASLACRAASQALAHLEDFRANVRSELGAEAEGLEVDLRIGVSTGEMIVGTIGSEVSRSFTVMGDPVNLGSRLEGANKAYGTRIIISEETREAAGTDVVVRELDLIAVKGKERPVRVFELLASNANSASAFEDGLRAYRACDWDAAEAAFNAAPDDPPSLAYLERITQLRAEPPEAGWDGVWRFETK